MSSIGFNYAHVHVQQERLKEKIRRSDQGDEGRGKDATQQEPKRGKAAKKIHPADGFPAPDSQHNSQQQKA
nr:hypothetical protein A4A49_20662 [Ipomoea batatas]GMD16747.1 hypothetical protein A4A49_20662 [Ipomoea batatas]GME13860.1 hypothetical protein A4A49_20662 [Ipomoea batatas]